MKKVVLFAFFCALLCAAWAPPTLRAQAPDSYPNYVVIGAFAYHRNAVNFTEDANKNNYPAKFEMNRNRKLYYVYVLTTGDRDSAFTEALKYRTDTKYWDAWVFSGPLGDAVLHDGIPVRDFNPVTREEMPSVSVNHSAERRNEVAPTTDELNAAGHIEERHQEPETGNTVVPEPANNHSVETASEAEDPPARQFPKRSGTAPLKAEEVAGKNFFFQLTRADNGAWVEGEIDVIDLERSRKTGTYEANHPVKVSLPAAGPGTVGFVCQVFGYRKQQILFNVAEPSPEFFLDTEGNIVVPFELVRLQKGDIAIMYNVFFFKDAAIMRPESRYEVNNLLELLNENPGYRIKIHGHTNGNASGKIIRMGTADGFYSLTGTKQGFGSAKKLSEERAQVIRQFLISSGIEEDRMEIKAWGGRKPLHDKNSVRAVENVRVEIEILSD